MLDKWTIDNPTKWKTYLTNSGRIPSAQKQGIIPGVAPLHIAKVKYHKICISQGNSQNTTLLSTFFSTKGVLPAPLPVVATGKSTHIVENHFTAKPLAMQKLNFWTYNNCFLELLLALLLGHWFEIIALYYVKSISTEISASRQDRRVLQKSKIIRIEFLSKWGMLDF